MSKEYLVNAYLRHSNNNKQSKTKVVCFSNFKKYHDFPVSILNTLPKQKNKSILYSRRH